MAKQGPISGKMAVDRIAAITAGSWKPSPGSVYPLLKKLEHDGLLKHEATAACRGRQLFYSITAKGNGELERQKKEYLSGYGEHFNSLFPLVFQLLQLDAGKELDNIVLGLSKALASCKKSPLKQAG